jgi:hypothetical protein
MMRCLVLIKISKLWTAINVAAARSLDPKRRSEAILQGPLLAQLTPSAKGRFLALTARS